MESTTCFARGAKTSNLWAVEEKSEWWRRSNRDPVQLTFGPMNYYQPLPSRNGKTIFAIGTLPSGELVRYDAKQKDFVPFLGGLSADHLEFSRDGQWIAYVTLPERTLWRARSDGSESFQLTFPPMQVDSRPHWSADGKRITFGAKLPGELMRLYTISPERALRIHCLAGRTRKRRPTGCPEETPWSTAACLALTIPRSSRFIELICKLVTARRFRERKACTIRYGRRMATIWPLLMLLPSSQRYFSKVDH